MLRVLSPEPFFNALKADVFWEKALRASLALLKAERPSQVPPPGLGVVVVPTAFCVRKKGVRRVSKCFFTRRMFAVSCEAEEFVIHSDSEEEEASCAYFWEVLCLIPTSG